MVKPLLLTISILAALLCLLLSLASSPQYLVLVSSALLFAAAHLSTGALFVLRAQSAAKWLLLLLAVPVSAYAIDDIGRLLSLLGLPSFRVLV